MHYVRNFKSFENAEVDLLRPVTYVVGPNGSGKTNLIEAVELLSFIASGQPLHEVSDFGRGGRFEAEPEGDAWLRPHRQQRPTP